MEYKPGDVLVPHPNRWSPGFIAKNHRFTVVGYYDTDTLNGRWSDTSYAISSCRSEHFIGVDEEYIVSKILTKYNL